MATRTEIQNVILFGSSVANGLGAPGRRGWAQQLESRLYEANPHYRQNNNTTFSNLAVIGNTSYDVELAIGNGEARRRKLPEGCSTLSIVAVGSQDVWKDFKEHGEKLDLVGFAERMGRIAAGLFELGDVMYVGIPTPDIARMKVLSSRFNEVTLDDVAGAIQEYEQTAVTVMGEVVPGDRRYQPVPLFEGSADPNNTAYEHHPDIIHPAAGGHQWIYDQVVPVFDTMVGIKSR
ncbi:MAG: SGNH/GDSL hydrolase family protein [Candidatus Saccharimonadales bacterium]